MKDLRKALKELYRSHSHARHLPDDHERLGVDGYPLLEGGAVEISHYATRDEVPPDAGLVVIEDENRLAYFYE